MNLSNIAISCVCLGGIVAGCVAPGLVDNNEIYRLQQAVRSRGPQNRSEENTEPMTPGSSIAPNLPVTTDAKTGVITVKMSLNDVLFRVLANNPDIAVVSYSPDIARQQVIQAAAAFDFTFFGSTGYDHSDMAMNDRTPLGTGASSEKHLSLGIRQRTVTGAEWSLTNTMVRSWDDRSTFRARKWYSDDLALQVTQPLLRNAWPDVNLAGLRIARLSHKISLSQFRTQVESTITDTLTAYYNLQQAQGNVVITKDLLAVTQKTYQKVWERREVDATEVTIQQSLSRVKARTGLMLEAENTMGDAQDALVTLMSDPQINLMEKVRIEPTTPMSEAPVTIDQDDQLMTAIRLNPQLEQSRLAIQQLIISERVAKWNQLPDLNFVGGAGLNGASSNSRSQVWDDLVGGNYVSYSGMITFEVPIGNRLRKAEYAQARLERLQAVADMESVADTLTQQIRQRIRAINTSYKVLGVERETQAASEAQLRALDAMEETIASLTPEFLNLKLQAQGEVASAKQRVLQSITTYNAAMVDLHRVTGSVMEMNQVKTVLPLVDRVRPLPEGEEAIDNEMPEDPEEQTGWERFKASLFMDV
jgi:outer membrane protein TolC